MTQVFFRLSFLFFLILSFKIQLFLKFNFVFFPVLPSIRLSYSHDPTRKF